MSYPRVLITALGRINATDSSNNGLLLRNLFGAWPKENLAQVYSSGDRRDEGHFGHYYRLGPEDRRMGRLFYRLKAEALEEEEQLTQGEQLLQRGLRATIKKRVREALVGTNCYELVFKPSISHTLSEWVKNFSPDIIFAQGYCLTFSWLPIMLKERFGLPLIYYPTDDWPNAEYRSASRKVPLISRLMDRVVDKVSRQLVEMATVRIAFNPYMKEEYLARYGKTFDVLMHGDDPERFLHAVPKKVGREGAVVIVSTGVFNDSRIPLLEDLDQACAILKSRGHDVDAVVFPVNDMSREGDRFKHIRFLPCPEHKDLPAILKGADILFLPERFDGTANGVRLSISSKAHLFMFSGTPTVVYSDKFTGIARYAKERGWATLVDEPSKTRLADAMEQLIADRDYRQTLSMNAIRLARENHSTAMNQRRFYELVVRCLKNQNRQ